MKDFNLQVWGVLPSVYSPRNEFENTLVPRFYSHKLDIFFPQKDRAWIKK